jgi:precorrin-4/cobalt-precorrin-4 C11-methyltransferase
LANYSADTPVALIQKATWPQEKIHVGRLGALLDEVAPGDWALSTLMIVGDVLKRENAAESRLYAANYSHRFRKGTKAV